MLVLLRKFFLSFVFLFFILFFSCFFFFERKGSVFLHPQTVFLKKTSSLFQNQKEGREPSTLSFLDRKPASGPKEIQKGKKDLSLVELSHRIEKVSQAVLKTVVSLQVKFERLMGFSGDPFFPFGDFFGLPFGHKPQEVQSGGSGFIINVGKGLVLTNYHVVSPQAQRQSLRSSQAEDWSIEELNEKVNITAKTVDGRFYTGEPIGIAPDWDLALLKVSNLDKNDQVESAVFAQEPASVGTLVVAAGSPFGLESSVTFGIISSGERHDLETGQVSLNSFIQTDAAINPGNSGGPLVNMQGEVVGVSTALIGSNVNAGVGLAIPAVQAKEVLKSLQKYGHYKKGTLGVNVTDLKMLDDELKKANDLPPELTGVIIHSVVKGSAAEKSGLEAGDVIYEWNGKALKGASDLIRHVATSHGRSVKLGILRAKRKFEVSVTVDEFHGSLTEDPHEEGLVVSTKSKLSQLGLKRAQVLKKEQAKELGVFEGYGVKILEISREGQGLFKRFGLQKGDVITKVNQKEIRTLRDLEKALGQGQKAQYLFTLYRNGTKITLLYNYR